MNTDSEPSEKHAISPVDELTEQNIQQHIVGFINETGNPLTDLRQVSDLFGNAWFTQIETLAIPLARLPDNFFTLSSGVAGEILRRAANYNILMVVLGDIKPYTQKSKSFADFVREANRGEYVWFLADKKTLTERFSTM